MKRAVAVFFLLLSLQTSCQDNSPVASHVLDLKSFQVEAPETWRIIPAVGYDSQIGSLTDGKHALSYDYGWYSYTLKDETSATHLRTFTTIDGRPALIVRPKKRGQGIIGLYITNDQNHLSMVGHDIRDETTILRLFQSVRFR
jgi:hypothetical protein